MTYHPISLSTLNTLIEHLINRDVKITFKAEYRDCINCRIEFENANTIENCLTILHEENFVLKVDTPNGEIATYRDVDKEFCDLEEQAQAEYISERLNFVDDYYEYTGSCFEKGFSITCTDEQAGNIGMYLPAFCDPAENFDHDILYAIKCYIDTNEYLKFMRSDDRTSEQVLQIIYKLAMKHTGDRIIDTPEIAEQIWKGNHEIYTIDEVCRIVTTEFERKPEILESLAWSDLPIVKAA